MINGNLEGIRASLLREMEALYALEIPEDIFVPEALVAELARFTGIVRREISVYIGRGGDVMDVTVGGTESVPLTDMRIRRSAHRLSGVRCIHTHPGGSPELSDVDLTALISLKLDAMAAIGVLDGKATGIQAAFLAEPVDGEIRTEETGVIAVSRIPQADWMRRIAEADTFYRAGVLAVEENEPERVILVGIESEESLEELRALAETAGAEVVQTLLQKRDKPDNATYIGSGKVEQLALQAQASTCGAVIIDDELSGAQTRNLERALGVKVVDRTTLILDIFAQRAQSRAGKLQVEMAQLTYKLPRLMGQGTQLSRLGGGIGTRGPGETKLEIDRRRIRDRLSDLREEVDELSRQRATQRARREKSDIPIVALVGYTNTGKSTLLNLLSGASVTAEDKLFATLDPVTRRVPLPDGGEYLLVDTVGFIRKLPHALVDAFRSTLEEAVLADLLVIVSDAGAERIVEQRDVVLEVLGGLGVKDKPIIDAVNKIDTVDEPPLLPGAVPISAKTGQGIDALTGAIERWMSASKRMVTLLVPFAHGTVLSQLHDGATVISESYEAGGTRVTVRLEPTWLNKIIATLGAEALQA